MQPRTAVAEVLRVVARQHTRLRGLIWEVAQTSGDERQSAVEWLSHYLLLHAAAEQVGFRRAPAGAEGRAGVTPRLGRLIRLTQGLDLGLDPDESVVSQRVADIEAAAVRHARLQEGLVLPRLLATWPLADLHRAVAALEAADTVFDHGPPAALAVIGTTEAQWHLAVADLERVMAASAEGRQAVMLRDAMTTAAPSATTPTRTVTTAVRTT